MFIADERPSSATLEISIPPRSHEWQIEIQDDEDARIVPVTGERLIVGTARDADIVVRDPTVSARHCAIAVLGSGVAIEDLGSTNGTFVGNARVKEAWGAAGTTATIGRSTLVFWPVPRADDVVEVGPALPGVAGGSLAMRRLASQVRRLARHSEPVLICGESGTGKELIARALHREGPRRDKPFVVVNMASLPRDLVESELFGHERGAFTGAVARKIGAFQDAEGGTLFLDEIGELPLEAQPKLLRALEYEVRSVGGSGSGRRGDVRVIAATLVVLEERVTEHRFRLDLFHRLEAFVVDVPPLRARRGDIAAIARAVVSRMTRDFGPRQLTPGALARLASHDWPGNVRELRNVLLRACDLSEAVIDDDHIDRALRTRRSDAPPASSLSPSLARTLLDEHNGNMSAAARAASMPRTTFRKILESKRSEY